jgi:anthranilate phosphoribosyltransferase
MKGDITAAQVAAFLTALRMKGETVEEITGAAEAMREAALPVRCGAAVVVDTCGTGGDGTGSFNISTAAAFVVAGAGFTVAKHGNRSVSSQCGSADVLEEMGLPIEIAPELAQTLLREVGIAFLFAPRYHPATRHAAPVRRELGIRTIFNLLGPLSNPARPNVQLVGVYDAVLVESIARVLVHLGCRQGAVVNGGGHDEIVLSGPTQVAEIIDGRVHKRIWSPKDFGLKRQPALSHRGGARQKNAEFFYRLLRGEGCPFREIVAVNAAAAIQAAARQSKQALSLPEAYQIALNSLDEKKALGKFEALKAAVKRLEPHG